jgi:hypothetical protein
VIAFKEQQEGTFEGVDPEGRLWRIRRTRAGWRLEFQDPGDETIVNAGLHGSLDAARREANHPIQRVVPRPPDRR